MTGLLLPLAGLLAAALLWAAGASWMGSTTPVASAFAPTATAEALQALLFGSDLWAHVAFSLQRIAVGLAIALALGIPLGVLTGLSPLFSMATTPLFQFARMISPLSWMPIAVMVLGVGDAPVYFLLAFAAVWPILLNTAAGVSQLDANWLLLARSRSATCIQTLLRVLLPGIWRTSSPACGSPSGSSGSCGCPPRCSGFRRGWAISASMPATGWLTPT
jgi:NitT/TauT family transport system permease protein